MHSPLLTSDNKRSNVRHRSSFKSKPIFVRHSRSGYSVCVVEPQTEPAFLHTPDDLAARRIHQHKSFSEQNLESNNRRKVSHCSASKESNFVEENTIERTNRRQNLSRAAALAPGTLDAPRRWQHPVLVPDLPKQRHDSENRNTPSQKTAFSFNCYKRFYL